MAIPLCPYFGKCNGCTAQHLDYGQQLSNKKKWLAKMLSFPEAEIPVFSGEEYFYRNRLDFLIRKGKIMLRKKEGGEVEVEKCVIARKEINILLEEVHNFFSSSQLQAFSSLIIRATHLGDSALIFVLDEDTEAASQAEIFLKQFSRKTTARNVILVSENKKENEEKERKMKRSEEAEIGEEAGEYPREEKIIMRVVKGAATLQEKLREKTFHFPVQGFFQNNTVVAESLHQYVCEVLEKYPLKNTLKNATLLDLYAGVGTFGILNADYFSRVIVVESFLPSAEVARQNLQENKVQGEVLTNIQHLRKLLVSSSSDTSSHLYVITDPPRSGMEQKAISLLRELQPEVIIYVSCNPVQLGKDIKKFKEYELKSVALFDLFPQTPHLEAVAELVKKNI